MRKDVTPRDTLLDRRVVERNIRKGVVTREEYDGFLASLPDVGGNAETVRAKLGEPELDDSDNDSDDDDGDDAED